MLFGLYLNRRVFTFLVKEFLTPIQAWRNQTSTSMS
jgi:hypothetical protein